jgi:hypothetical protein
MKMILCLVVAVVMVFFVGCDRGRVINRSPTIVYEDDTVKVMSVYVRDYDGWTQSPIQNEERQLVTIYKTNFTVNVTGGK